MGWFATLTVLWWPAHRVETRDFESIANFDVVAPKTHNFRLLVGIWTNSFARMQIAALVFFLLRLNQTFFLIVDTCFRLLLQKVFN